MEDLDNQLDKLKKYSANKDIEKLNKKIYNLDLSDDYLKSLSESFLFYIHTKLHNAIAYKKPFAKFEKLKIMHDRIIKLMKNHHNFDKLDQ